MAEDYATFLERKSQLGTFSGFDPIWMPSFLFDFQQHLVDWAIRKGKAAIFADTGLGKTPMQLVFAENVVRKTGRPVLILTPLAVGPQTVTEGAKFGIEVARSRDGKHSSGITVTNYEKLHLFNPQDFAGVVCDECFPAGTLVNTPSGCYNIETIREGDEILNASGVDVVSGTHRREVEYAVAITIAEGKRILCSPNHPFFTCRGWVGAQDLEPGDSILQTASAVRMVREDVSSTAVSGFWSGEVLREILLSEMANESAGPFGEGPQPGDSSQAREGKVSVVRGGIPEGGGGEGTYSQPESDGGPGSEVEGFEDSPGHGARTFRAWRKRQANTGAASNIDGCVRAWGGSRVEHIVGLQGSRLSDLLQARLRAQRAESRYRSGWKLSLQPEGTGHQEGCEIGFSRVEGLEVLEQGHPELERLRSSDGKLYFHDLTGTRHPSFSVAGLLVHNSSILKHFSGATQKSVTRFMLKVPYRLLCTATAAPNDYVELGTSSEALGELGHTDMLTRFFRQTDNKPHRRQEVKEWFQQKRTSGNHFAKLSFRVSQGIGQWRMKGHAIVPFWRWVSSWARACRRPSDLGFDDGKFLLPALIENEHIVEPRRPPNGMLFTLPAFGLREEREERRRTIDERCELVASLVNHDRPAVVWCHLNIEGDRLEKEIPGCIQIKGSLSEEEKEERFGAFSSGGARVLVIKPKIGAFGLNWQFCNHVVTFASHSYEQFYQSVRRCYRYGQTRPVTVDIIATTGEKYVRENMASKAESADKMFSELVSHMNDAVRISASHNDKERVIIPEWVS